MCSKMKEQSGSVSVWERTSDVKKDPQWPWVSALHHQWGRRFHEQNMPKSREENKQGASFFQNPSSSRSITPTSTPSTLLAPKPLLTAAVTQSILPHAGCEAKIEKSEKADSHQESNPGHLWLEPPILCHWATTAGQPPATTILYMFWSTPNGVLTAHTEWLPGVQLRHSVPPVQYI